MLKKLAEVLWRILNPQADLSSLNRRSSQPSDPQKTWDDLPEPLFLPLVNFLAGEVYTTGAG